MVQANCSVYGCNSNSKSKNITFHRFPRDARLPLWIKACQRPDLENKTPDQLYNKYVCELHFEPWMYINTKLKSAAIPIKNLPSGPIYGKSTPAEAPTIDLPQDFPSSSGTLQKIDSSLLPVVSTVAQTSAKLTDHELRQQIMSSAKKLEITEDASTADVAQQSCHGWESGESGYGALIEAATTILQPCTVCCVFGCQNSVRNSPEKTFVPFPAQPERYLHWLKLISREDLTEKLKTKDSDHRICSDHFDASDFNDGVLNDDALPHLKLLKKGGNVVYADYGGCMELEEVKIEPPEEMEVEIYFEPEQPPTVKFNEPKQPTPTLPTPTPTPTPIPPTPALKAPVTVTSHKQVDTMDIEAVDIPVFQISKKQFDANPIEKPVKISNDYYVKLKEKFFKNATISCIEHVSLPVGEPTVEQVSVHVQTTKDLIDKMNVPMKKKYEEEIRNTKKRLKLLEEESKNSCMDQKKFIASCDKYLDEKMANIVKAHATLLQKHTGNRYSTNFKTFALNLYLCSPQSYRFVEQFFYLPSMSTIKRFQTPVRTGINKNLIQSLKIKVEQMSEKDKMCTVCFDFMGVNKNLYYDVTNDLICGLHEIDQVLGTEPAQYAPTIMVRGLYSKWKQPVSFALVAEKKYYPELKDWVHSTIAMLFDIGLNVKAFSANLDSEFLDFSDISVTEPFFEVQERKIYQIFDVPFLFKSAREDFMKYDFHFGSKVAKWSHILEVYDADKKQELRLMPKLTEQHVRQTEETENDVKLAVEVFSRSVAAAMNFYVIAHLIDKKAKHTVEFIQTMNNLFDILNSQRLSSENEYKRAYKGTEEQNRYLVKTLEYLRQLEMKDEAGNVIEKKNFITGLLITIKSVVNLIEDLQAENLKYLLTKHLSKDCLERYFSEVREQAGASYARPTSIMFARSFRRLFLMNLVSNTKKGGTEVDLQSTLAKISDYVKLDVDWKKEDEEKNISLKVGCTDYQELWPVPSIDFIAGYLLRKCLETHECESLVENLCHHYNLEADELLQNFKNYDGKNLKKKMTLAPPDYFVDFVERMDTIFKNCSEIRAFGFGRNIYNRMDAEIFDMPCHCFPVEFMKFLFIRMKIFHTVKNYNLNNKPTRRRNVKN